MFDCHLIAGFRYYLNPHHQKNLERGQAFDYLIRDGWGSGLHTCISFQICKPVLISEKYKYASLTPI